MYINVIPKPNKINATELRAPYCAPVYTRTDDCGDEGYCLSVTEDGIKVFYSTEAGKFYADTTLTQLNEGGTLPVCEIEDRPRYAHRAFMLDEARHFFGKEVVKQTLDMMALVKLNVFHWHLTDDQGWRVEIKKYPLLTEKGSIRKSTQLNLIGYNQGKEPHDGVEYGRGKFYTQEDVKEIVAYAAERHINIIPEVDMPGHLMAVIANYPNISCFNEDVDVSDRWGVMDTIGCCGKDDVYNFAKDVIDELSELFPYEYFHIGGDEVPKTKWKKCPACQAKIKELGLRDEEELQAHFTNRILQYLKIKGKKLIGWDEILRAGTLSDETVAQWWEGRAATNGVEKWVKKGNKIVLSYGPYVYLDHFYSMKDLKKTYSLDPVKVGLGEEYADGVIGLEAPLWTEYVRDKGKFDFNAYPRMQALAEICWTDKANKDFADFDGRLQSFFRFLDAEGIAYAPREAYLCRGLKGLIRMIRCGGEWRKDPNSEYMKYRRK